MFESESELLASLHAAAKSVNKVVAHGKSLVKSLEKLDAPKSLERQDYLSDAIEAMKGVDLTPFGCGAYQKELIHAMEQRLRALRATAHQEIMSGIVAGVDKPEHLRVLSDNPLVIYVHPLTVEIHFDKLNATWTYAHEVLQTVSLVPSEILSAHRELVDVFRASRIDSSLFWTLLKHAYEMVLIKNELPSGSRIDIVEMLPAMAWLWPNPAVMKKTGTFPRYLLAYQIQKLRADGMLQNKGQRLELGTATGGSTRNKQNVLFIPQGASEGQYYLSLCFR